MIGLTKASLFDLEKAEVMAEQDAAATRPSWLKLIELANEYDYPSLNIHVRDRGGDLELAALLWFRSVELGGSQALAIEVAKRALQAAPLCVRIMQGVDRSAGVAYKHMTTQATFPMLAACIRERLPQLAAEEAILADVVDRHADSLADPVSRVEFLADLVQAAGTDKDRAEPSLAVLGRLIEEEDVLHVAKRAEFLRDYLGVDSSTFLDQTVQVYREHPLGAVISALRLERGLHVDQYEAIVGKAVIQESNLVSSGPLFNRLPRETRFKNTTRGAYHVLRWAHFSSSDIEYEHNMATKTTITAKVQTAKWMFDTNPHAPYRFVVLIEHDWDNSQEHLDEWEERYGHHPSVALALAKRFEADGDFDKAEEYYTDYIAAVADFEAYVRLARLHHRRGDKYKMLEVATAFLEQEDYGLTHASMSKTIAYTLMADGQYKEALPWAERSAQSYSAWGLRVLADCYEGLKDLEKAEKLRHAIDERYEQSSLYEFVARTGRGDLDEAWQGRLAYLRRYYPQDEPFTYHETLHQAYQGKLDLAVPQFQQMFNASGDPMLGLSTAAMAVRSGQEPIARSILQAISDGEFAAAPDGARLKEFVQLLLQMNEASDLDSAKVEKLALGPSQMDYARMNFAAGCFLDAKGDRDRAVRHYQEAARSPYRETVPVVLAWIRLRELGEDPLEVFPYYAGIEAGAD